MEGDAGAGRLNPTDDDGSSEAVATEAHEATQAREATEEATEAASPTVPAPDAVPVL